MTSCNVVNTQIVKDTPTLATRGHYKDGLLLTGGVQKEAVEIRTHVDDDVEYQRNHKHKRSTLIHQQHNSKIKPIRQNYDDELDGCFLKLVLFLVATVARTISAPPINDDILTSHTMAVR